jgi:hypothetical protein
MRGDCTAAQAGLRRDPSTTKQKKNKKNKQKEEKKPRGTHFILHS